MGLRHMLAIPILLWVLVKILKDPKFGIYAFIAILFCTPSSLFWGFESWRLPLVMSSVLLISTVRFFNDRNRLDTSYSKVIKFWWFALYACLILSLLFSYDMGRSFDILYDKWSKTFLFCWLLVLWIKDEKDIHTLLVVIVTCFLVLALRGVYRYQAGYEELTGLAGSMMDRNDFALHLMMVFPFAYYLSELEKDVLRKRMYIGISAVIAICVVMTFSRMGLLLNVSAAIMMSLFSSNKVKFLLLIFVLGASILSFMPQSYFERMSTIKSYEDDPSAMGRLAAWEFGIKMGEDHLLTGVGLDCFEIPKVFSKYSDAKPYVAHNTYVQLFAEGGIFALSSWLMLVISTIFSSLTGTKRVSNSPALKVYYKACVCSLILYLIGAVLISVEDRELIYILIASVIVLNSVSAKSLRLETGET